MANGVWGATTAAGRRYGSGVSVRKQFCFTWMLIYVTKPNSRVADDPSRGTESASPAGFASPTTMVEKKKKAIFWALMFHHSSYVPFTQHSGAEKWATGTGGTGCCWGTLLEYSFHKLIGWSEKSCLVMFVSEEISAKKRKVNIMSYLKNGRVWGLVPAEESTIKATGCSIVFPHFSSEVCVSRGDVKEMCQQFIYFI